MTFAFAKLHDTHVHKLTSSNVQTFFVESAPTLPRALLFSSKSQTPDVWKALSIEFEDRLVFGFIPEDETAVGLFNDSLLLRCIASVFWLHIFPCWYALPALSMLLFAIQIVSQFKVQSFPTVLVMDAPARAQGQEIRAQKYDGPIKFLALHAFMSKIAPAATKVRPFCSMPVL